ncbi:MAG: signal peptidase II [Bdellovibrionaceae bacterium]|nr:signal peptidase II [Pseudobdellovibrionaceae bacterium]
MSNPFIKYLSVVLTASWILCLDQATKIFIHTQFPKQESKTIIDGFFNISYVTNSGGAFGIFNDSHAGIRFILFLLFPLVCVYLIFKMLQETSDRFQVMALSFILGGAFGNYLDRLRLGYVVDFIDWHFKGWHWPTFNIADSFIVVGVAILCVLYFKEYRQSKNQSQ